MGRQGPDFETVDADGKTTSFSYTAKLDGKDYPVSGSDDFDAIAIKRIDDNTAVATLKKGGKQVSTARRVVSKDGKTLTLTITGTNAKGEKLPRLELESFGSRHPEGPHVRCFVEYRQNRRFHELSRPAGHLCHSGWPLRSGGRRRSALRCLRGRARQESLAGGKPPDVYDESNAEPHERRQEPW